MQFFLYLCGVNKKRFYSSAAVAMLALSAMAQQAVDSTRVDGRWIAPVAGAGVMTVAASVSRPASRYAPAASDVSEGFGVVDVMEYAPLVLPWAVKACGGATRSGWGRMAVSQGAGLLLMAGGTYLTKHVVDERRPDGSDTHSFPSGHSAWAFMGATMATRELGWRSPWYSVGAYAVASAVGMERVVSRRHYPVDVVAGAGIGILSTQIGYLIGDAIFCGRGLDSRYRFNEGEASAVSYFGIKSGLSFPLNNNLALGGGKMHFQPGYFTAVDGAVVLGRNFDLGGEVAMTATPVEYMQEATMAGPGVLNQLSVVVTGGYTVVPSGRFSLRMGVGAGYQGNMHLKHLGGLVDAGSGSAVGALDVTAVMPLTQNLCVAAELGYRLSGYDYKYNPGGESISGTSSSLVLSLSSRVTF